MTDVRRAAALFAALLCLPLATACTGGGHPGGATSANGGGGRPSSGVPPKPGLNAAAGDAPPLPAGQSDGWDLVFSDEFDATTLDRGRWADRSTAEPDGGRGNVDNQQLEWNQVANCQVSGGELDMIAKREPFTSPSGTHYDWTSCLITTTPSHSFRFGYLEERSILPGAKGFWPAFWTWQARGVNQHAETDVYEFYSDNHGRLYGTQYSQGQGRCDWHPPFDPTTGWHTYGVAIEPSGTSWYVDGARTCHTDATSDATTNIISNLAVYSKIPPERSTTSATKRVDYIRAWKSRTDG
jgi:beta-glucanase (GH16 family)